MWAFLDRLFSSRLFSFERGVWNLFRGSKVKPLSATERRLKERLKELESRDASRSAVRGRIGELDSKADDKNGKSFISSLKRFL